MKNLLFTVITFLSIQAYSQGNPVSSVVNICSGVSEEDASDNTYFKDVNNAFDKFTGTWIYTNGNEMVVFVIAKVTQHYFPLRKVYNDYLIGNYSYSTDGGNTFVINTYSGINSFHPDTNPMYAPCLDDDFTVDFAFKDVVLNKDFCSAIFEFLPGSLTQMQVTIKNPQGSIPQLEGTPPYNFNFTLPTSMIVTKQ